MVGICGADSLGGGKTDRQPSSWLTWLATVLWSFGVGRGLRMVDQADDRHLGIHGSVRSLGSGVGLVVAMAALQPWCGGCSGWRRPCSPRP